MADSSFRINRGITLNPQASAPTAPTNGDIYYDSALGTFVFYDNGQWINLASRIDVASAGTLTSSQFTASVVQSSLVRLTGATSGTIHGLTASTDGKTVVLYNNTNQLITIAHQSGTEATAANRIVTHTAASIVVPSGMVCTFVYDSNQSRWVFAAPAIDGLDKLFEDRNVLLTQGGLITFTGTALQFTEALALEINQREAGGAPIVISLGSSDRALSATGRMLYAVIDRVAGTAVVTADATSLPAAVPVNQEVFLIAKRVDAADGTKRVYFRQGTALDEGQTVRLGSSGSGSGSGVGDDINTLKFRASFSDTLDDKKAINSTSGYTDDTLYNAGKKLYRLSYDATKTVTGTGVSMTLSGTPSFTIKNGDILRVGTEVRRISNLTSQTVFDVDAAFTTNPSTAACTVSQAVHTVDIASFNDSGNGLALNSIYSDALSSYMITYRDSAALDDAVFDSGTPALVGFSASTNNSTWGTVGTRADSIASDNSKRATASDGTSFYLRFFANATSGSGAVNFLDYKVFLYEDTSASASGGTTSKALARTDGAGTAVNCSVSSSTGKTRITTTFVTGSEVSVWLDGKKLPEFVDSTLTPDGYFKRISGTVIELDSDYSGAGLQVEIILPSSTVDNTNVNSTNISILQDMATAGFQGFVDESARLVAVNGTPSTGQFRTLGIVGRASIPDITNDLKTRMGIERVQTQQIVELQNEFGPNGERVYGLVNDDKGLVRFVGSWFSEVETRGQYINGSVQNDFIEIVFYGTGLNLLVTQNTGNVDFRASIDGGAEGGQIVGAGSAILSSRNYSSNQVFSVVSGLSLGLHTVKLRLNSSGVTARVTGFEILNESSTINVRPGTAYIGGKKLVLSAAQTLAYNSTFDSIFRDGASVGSLSTRGARVLTYIKSDGTVGKSAVTVDSTQKNLTLADHTNEEAVRRYHMREFGAGRSDDFSAPAIMGTTSSNYAFTLDDGVTSLMGSGISERGTGGAALEANGSYITFTFVGTGCDLIRKDSTSGGADTYSVSVNGTSIGNLSSTGNTAQRIEKLVSGLPYGTHVVKITRVSAATFFVGAVGFIVYQPKKPTLPSGAVELADYNVMADFSVAGSTGTDAASHLQTPTGVLCKSSSREFAYIGTWSASLQTFDYAPQGWQFATSTTSDYVEYTFFGTGVVVHPSTNNAGTYNFSVTIDGVLNASGTSVNANVTNSGGGSYQVNVFGSNQHLRVVFSGLTLGVHKVRLTRTGGTGNMNLDGFDVITPIHAHKSNLYADLQNTLTVGSCAISDTRKTGLVKDSLPDQKATLQAIQLASTSTTSTTLIPMVDMSLTLNKAKAGRVLVMFSGVTGSGSGSNQVLGVALFVNGVQVSSEKTTTCSTSVSFPTIAADQYVMNLGAGAHKIDMYWRVSSGGGTPTMGNRTLTVVEL